MIKINRFVSKKYENYPQIYELSLINRIKRNGDKNWIHNSSLYTNLVGPKKISVPKLSA